MIRRLMAILITMLGLLFISSPALAYNPFGDVCTKAPSSPTCQQYRKQAASNTNPVVDTIQKAVNLIAVVAGILSVIVMIIAGFMFVTAGGVAPGQRSGDPNRVKTARSALLGAAIGLVIIALSWTIVTFVVHTVVK